MSEPIYPELFEVWFNKEQYKDVVSITYRIGKIQDLKNNCHITEVIYYDTNQETGHKNIDTKTFYDRNFTTMFLEMLKFLEPRLKKLSAIEH